MKNYYMLQLLVNDCRWENRSKHKSFKDAQKKLKFNRKVFIADSFRLVKIQPLSI